MALQPQQSQAGDDALAQDEGSKDDPIASLQADIAAIPVEANDTDLIEKEWVEKAKQIVNQLSDDPYKQQQELSKLKATYMKKRYDKDIKLTDG